jgi:hypothetical protein
MPKNIIIVKNPQFYDNFTFFLKSEKIEQTEYPIYVSDGPHKIEEYIYVNTEQMTRKNQLQRIIDLCKTNKPREFWDYSAANCKILESHGIHAKHVPLSSPQWYLEKLKSWRNDIEYDVGFCGDVSSKRRQTILDDLKTRGIKVNIVKEWGETRDKELAKCHILINIHFASDYNIFEQARCEPWLSIGVPVISEHSLDDDPRCINVEYSKLVDAVVSFLKAE